MKRLGTALVIALSLAACQTSRGGGGAAAGGVDVTRTHLGGQIARAQIAVEPVNAADVNNPEFGAFADAVERLEAAEPLADVANLEAHRLRRSLQGAVGRGTAPPALPVGWTGPCRSERPHRRTRSADLPEL